MISFDKLIQIFDITAGYGWPTKKPTETSIEYINSHFGISLPPKLIELANKSQNFGCWFASLGPDFSNDFHIITINRIYHRMRRCPHGDKWQRAKPRYLLVINHGHDDDCDCLDLRTWDSQTGDYPIQYWFPNIKESEPGWNTFHEYLQSLVLSQMKHVKADKKQKIEKILLT